MSLDLLLDSYTSAHVMVFIVIVLLGAVVGIALLIRKQSNEYLLPLHLIHKQPFRRGLPPTVHLQKKLLPSYFPPEPGSEWKRVLQLCESKRNSMQPELGPSSPTRSWRTFAVANAHLHAIRQEERALLL